MSSPTLSDPLNWVASVLMILNGIFGIIFNGVIVYNCVTTPSERTSFNLICAFRGGVNCIILGWGFIGTFVPLALLGDHLFPPVYHMIVITTVHSLYTGLQYCGLLVALNRFCALFIPLFYPTIFSVNVTFALTTAIFCYRIGKIVYELLVFIPLQCFSHFSSVDLSWEPDLSKICLENYVTVVDGSAILLSVLIAINLATFVKISLFYKSTRMDSREINKKMKKNRILFTQTILQDIAYLIDMLFTFKLSHLFSSRIWTFVSGSFIWQLVHSCDGLIMIMFNERLSFLRQGFFPSSSNPSIVQPKNVVGTTVTVSNRSNPVPIQFIMLMFNDRFSFLCARDESPESSTSAVQRRVPVHNLGSVR